MAEKNDRCVSDKENCIELNEIGVGSISISSERRGSIEETFFEETGISVDLAYVQTSKRHLQGSRKQMERPKPNLTSDGESAPSDDVTFSKSITILPSQLSRTYCPDALSETIPITETSDQVSEAKFDELNSGFGRCGIQLKNQEQIPTVEAMKVRNRKIDRKPGMSANSSFLESVLQGAIRDVEITLALTKLGEIDGLDKNCTDVDDRSALHIAIDNKDVGMVATLLDQDVDTGLSLFHAVSENFYEGVEVILKHGDYKSSEITEENNYFQIGMTPMLLAAHRNNYKILSLLHRSGHRLEKESQVCGGIDEAWEYASKRKMLCKARAQPAYITLFCEVHQETPMTYCLKEIQELKYRARTETEFSGFYKDCAHIIENFMCCLLDQICSSKELSEIFHYDIKDTNFGGENKLLLLEQAGNERLVRFVTHPQAQFAIAHLLFRSQTLTRRNRVQRTLLTIFYGFCFPLLSLFYIIAPNSRMGRLLALPDICFGCYMVSDITFAVLLVVDVSLKTTDAGKSGTPPTALECILLSWILGKWLQELRECFLHGVQGYFRSFVNYVDLTTLSLFLAGIIVRVVDLFENRSEKYSPPRLEWGNYEYKLIAEAIFALAYILVFVRLTCIMRVNRYLGPLHISLCRMLADVYRFLIIFVVVMLAFAFAFWELYWYYGTEEGMRIACNASLLNETSSFPCEAKVSGFANILEAIKTLFWANFGYFNFEKDVNLNGKHLLTQSMGRFLLFLYHVVMVIVVVNMLIAMMSKSYDSTSGNEAVEYMFDRTSIWIRFSRRDMMRPPPMNLIPNPRGITAGIQGLVKWLRGRKVKTRLQDAEATSRPTQAGRREEKIQRILLRRYKLKHFIGKRSRK